MDVPGTPPSRPNRDRWTEKIKNDLQEAISHHTRSPGGPTEIVMCRVEQQLRELKPEHYAAAAFSFGLFDRFPLDAPQTRADRCRICMTGAFLVAMGMTNDGSWEELCDEVVPDPKAMQDRYNELERDPLSLKDVQCVLTLDAVFLASYLGSKYNKDVFATNFPRLQHAIDPMTRAEKIHPLLVDLFKVENQIPLSLIRTVLKIMFKKAAVDNDSLTVDRLADEADKTFRKICEGAIDTFCSQLPGYDEDENYSETVDYLECDNFLGCMYKGMFYSSRIPKRRKNGISSVWVRWQTYLERKYRMRSEHGTTAELNGRIEQPSVTELREPAGSRGREVDDLELGQDRRPEHESLQLPECDLTPQKWKRGEDIVILPSVTELRKAGISFKGRKGYSFHSIFLEKGLLTATLHLPTLTMNDDTEIIWRNLVAYEHANENENPEFIQFLDFMDRLIDSQDDVKYLRSKRHPVILDNLLGTNEAVAKIFNNSVLQNSYYEATKKWKELHRDIFVFYNQPIRHWYLEFRKTYFSKPWLAISGIAAASLLVLTFLQTYYAAKAYYKEFK